MQRKRPANSTRRTILDHPSICQNASAWGGLLDSWVSTRRSHFGQRSMNVSDTYVRAQPSVMPSNENTRASAGWKRPADRRANRVRDTRIDDHATNTTTAVIVNSKGRGKSSVGAVLSLTLGARYLASAQRPSKPANTPPAKEPTKATTNVFIRVLSAGARLGADGCRRSERK